MKILIAIFLSLTALAADNEYIKSKDDIVFHTPDMFKFSDAGKISEFRGVIDRIYFSSHDLKMVDLYQFSTDEVKVSKSMCMNFIERIFGISQSRLFKLKTFKIGTSNKGAICEVFITDVNKVKEDPYLRYATIGFVNAKANVLVYHPTSLTDEKISEIRKFWNNLR